MRGIWPYELVDTPGSGKGGVLEGLPPIRPPMVDALGYVVGNNLKCTTYGERTRRRFHKVLGISYHSILLGLFQHTTMEDQGM